LSQYEAGETYEKKILVEKFTKQLDVKIIGNEPNLMITDPNGETYMADPLDGKNVMSIKNPIAGEWSMYAEDSSKFTTEIGISWEILVHYGFSIEKPSSLEETVRMPTEGMTLFVCIFLLS
jgi:hypothetical protein